MKVRIIVGASNAFASINGPDFSMDIPLNPGRSACASLRETAQEFRAKAERHLIRAERMEAAARILEN